ncbi:acyl carrier protein 3, mitochondrial-like isoform X2 [Miscanthus floridulus]|uniref:acyl carrier protein 3, mitochondrial-like isoform X2 n=1 Tax=Miscanthus floridulus TaxID=154761 RepID=UPI00345A2876
MQTVRSVVLQHLRLRAAPAIAARGGSGRPALYGFARGMSAPAGQEDSKGSNSDSERDIRTRVVNLVKKFDKIDADNVTETADFQKDLSLDSLDRVELVMAFEQEFSVEIPDDKADKLTCCADVAKYIISESQISDRSGGGS